MSKKDQDINYGIVGNVNATAVAIGAGSSAIVNQSGPPPSPQEFDKALQALRDQIAQLRLESYSMEVLQADIEKLKQMAGPNAAPNPNAGNQLESFVSKLKMAGVALQTAVGFHEPIAKIASWFGIPVPF